MKDQTFLLLSILLIFVLTFTTYWYFKNLSRPLSEMSLPDFETPNINDIFSQEGNNTYQEFVSPDGKLKLEHPSDWIKMSEEGLDGFNQTLVGEEAKNLLFAQKFDLEKGSLVFLIIQELSLDPGTDLEQTINLIKDEADKQDSQIDINNLQNIDDKTAYFEAQYKNEKSTNFYAREKIILNDNKAYLIILLNPNNDWSTFGSEANKILESVRVNN